MTKWLWKNIPAYDLIHIHAVFTYPSTIAAWIARMKGKPYIVRPLGILNRWGMRNRRQLGKKLSFWAIERGMLDHAALIHYTSEQERIEAEQAGARTASMIVANPADVNPGSRAGLAGKFRARYPALGNAPLIVFLSRISPKKGLDLLIPAFAQVRRTNPEAVLVIAGGGDADLIEEVKKSVSAAGLTDCVIWTGFIEGDDKGALLADADIFVLPSYSENFGVAVVEALSFGVPAIVSDQVGIHHEISQAHAGVVVPCQAAALAGALTELLDNADLRASMSANGANLAAKKFTRGGVVDALLANYRAILSGGASVEATATCADTQ
jgi:glycosyltransferase involved in cell wall biosynthesis